MTAEPTVFLVDDDPELRRSVRWMLEKAGFTVDAYASAEQFLAGYDPQRPGCLLADVRMPGMSGLELQREMTERGWPTPVIIISGHADVPMAVEALEAGAAAFIEKPFSRDALLTRIDRALQHDATERRRRRERDDIETRLSRLTPREQQVLDLVVAGKTTRDIAATLGASVRTIEVHRAHVMKKMKADSVVTLVRSTISYQLSAKPLAANG